MRRGSAPMPPPVPRVKPSPAGTRPPVGRPERAAERRDAGPPRRLRRIQGKVTTLRPSLRSRDPPPTPAPSPPPPPQMNMFGRKKGNLSQGCSQNPKGARRTPSFLDQVLQTKHFIVPVQHRFLSPLIYWFGFPPPPPLFFFFFFLYHFYIPPLCLL